MARKPMVTRTITTTQVTALCMDIHKCEPCNITVVLPRTFKDEEKLLKAVRAQVDNDDVKVVHIVDKQEVETLYGMTEQDFIKGAVKLDPNTRKAIDNAEGETEDDTEDESGDEE